MVVAATIVPFDRIYRCGDALFTLPPMRNKNHNVNKNQFRKKDLRLDLIRITDVARLLNVSRRRIHRWMKTGILKPVRVGKIALLRRSDLDAQ